MEDKNNTSNSVKKNPSRGNPVKKNPTKRNPSKKGSQEEISVTVGIVENTWTKEEYKEIAKAYNVTVDYLQSVQEDLQKKGPEGNQLDLSKSDETHFKNSKMLQDCFEQLSQQDDKKTKDKLNKYLEKLHPNPFMLTRNYREKVQYSSTKLNVDLKFIYFNIIVGKGGDKKVNPKSINFNLQRFTTTLNDFLEKQKKSSNTISLGVDILIHQYPQEDTDIVCDLTHPAAREFLNEILYLDKYKFGKFPIDLIKVIKFEDQLPASTYFSGITWRNLRMIFPVKPFIMPDVMNRSIIESDGGSIFSAFHAFLIRGKRERILFRKGTHEKEGFIAHGNKEIKIHYEEVENKVFHGPTKNEWQDIYFERFPFMKAFFEKSGICIFEPSVKDLNTHLFLNKEISLYYEERAMVSPFGWCGQLKEEDIPTENIEEKIDIKEKD